MTSTTHQAARRFITRPAVTARHTAVALVMLAALFAADLHAQGFVYDQQSAVGFDSAMYVVAPVSNDQHVNSVPAWDALGRHAATAAEIIPAQADGFRFDEDRATAWADYQQPAAGVDATLRSYALVSGYYLNGNAGNFATNHLHLVDTVTVDNSGPGAYFNLVQSTHGTLVSFGAVGARASETTSFIGGCVRGCYEVDQATPVQGLGGVWSGHASVVDATFSSPRSIEVGGDWAGTDTFFNHPAPTISPLAGVDGIELHVLLGTRTIYLGTGAKLVIDVDFEGDYSAGTGAQSGFLSYGEADFSGTGLLNYRAIDAVTGLPAAGVTFTLAPSPVPLPSGAVLCASALLALAAGAKRRARYRPA